MACRVSLLCMLYDMIRLWPWLNPCLVVCRRHPLWHRGNRYWNLSELWSESKRFHFISRTRAYGTEGTEPLRIPKILNRNREPHIISLLHLMSRALRINVHARVWHHIALRFAQPVSIKNTGALPLCEEAHPSNMRICLGQPPDLSDSLPCGLGGMTYWICLYLVHVDMYDIHNNICTCMHINVLA